MAQSAHAATAVLHENADTPEAKEYLTHLQSMRKTVMEVSIGLASPFNIPLMSGSQMKRHCGTWRRS
jgi:hypothetical protein